MEAQPEYSIAPAHRGGRGACRQCLFRALEAAGYDAEAYLKATTLLYIGIATAARHARLRPPSVSSPLQVATCRPIYKTRSCMACLKRALTLHGIDADAWQDQGQDQERKHAWLRKNMRLRRSARRGLTKDQWAFMQQLYNHRCAYCHKRPRKLTRDHIIPITKGGPTTWDNIVPACRRCNSRKGNRAAPPHQMVLKLG